MIRQATVDDPLRVAVLVSGFGSNLQALLDRFPRGETPVAIRAVVASRPGAHALTRAADAGVEHAVFPRGDDREARDAALGAWLDERGIELVVLAGFMELLTPAFVARRVVVNVHPSLLPAFPGRQGIADALAHGVKVTGVTVHLVDAGLDTGPILFQDAVQIDAEDDEASLAERIHLVEHFLLGDAVLALAQDRVEVDGRRTRVGW